MTQAEAVVATVHEPLLLLDDRLRARMASRAFYRTFEVEPYATVDRHFSKLGNGQWNVPPLLERLDGVIAGDVAFEHTFERIGMRTVSATGGGWCRPPIPPTLALVAIKDITLRFRSDREKADLLHSLRRSNTAVPFADRCGLGTGVAPIQEERET